MHRRRFRILACLSLFCAPALAANTRTASAQTAQPITSLPKAPDDTSGSNASYPAPPLPDNSVHPITSLPKPPQTAEPAPIAPAYPATPPAESAPTEQSPAATPPPAAEPILPAASPAPAPEPTPVPPSTPAPTPPAPQTDATPPHPAILPSAQPQVVRPRSIRAFSTAAVAIKIGVAGIGLDIATPLSQRFNLRAGGSFFSYTASFNEDGITIDGNLKFRSGTASLDWFPFSNGFRISPGVTFYNGNSLNANAAVPGGQTFTLNSVDYTSSTTDPVTGTASLSFGRRTAPSLTIGFGNMIPRSGRHISFPFEIGFQYIGPPLVSLNLQGTACDTGAPLLCAPVATDPTTQANLRQQENIVNSDIRPLRFYPILSQGVAVRF